MPVFSTCPSAALSRQATRWSGLVTTIALPSTEKSMVDLEPVVSASWVVTTEPSVLSRMERVRLLEQTTAIRRPLGLMSRSAHAPPSGFQVQRTFPVAPSIHRSAFQLAAARLVPSGETFTIRGRSDLAGYARIRFPDGTSQRKVSSIVQEISRVPAGLSSTRRIPLG